MAKKSIKAVVKLQLPGGKATPGQSVGSALGPHGIKTPEFITRFNEKTKDQNGMITPVVITIYQDKSYDFIIKTPPAATLIKKECNIEKGSAVPHKDKVGKIKKSKIKEIAELKMKDLNANDIDAAMKIIEGTARSMGVTVEQD